MPQQNISTIEIQAMRTPQGLIIGLILTAVTMLLLSIIQEPVGASLLAWVALCPWVISATRARSAKKAFISTYLFGFIYYLTNLYWLAGVTAAGYIALCFYMAWYFVFIGVILRSVYLHRQWLFTLVLPILWVGQEYLRATVMTGFPWLFLSHSQHHHFRLIQISDLVGAYGVTFLVVMVNGLFCDLLLRPIRRAGKTKNRFAFVEMFLLVACCISAAILYGQFRINQNRSTMSPGPTLSLIQEVIPQYVKEQGESDEDIFKRHLTLSEQALAEPVTPDLIVWPETMATSPLNHEFLQLKNNKKYNLSNYPPLNQSISFDSRLRQCAKKGTSLLVGTPSIAMKDLGMELRPTHKANSAVLYLPDGTKSPRQYDKMHLVPFGEVVPFKKSWPGLHHLLNRLTPYDYDYTLDAGETLTVFECPAAGKSTARFGVAICYEDVTPQVPRELTACENGQKRVDFLLNISNDGWFVRGGKNGTPVTATSELIQHLVICKFRAVENRIGIARAVNTGISAFIRPDGVVQGKPLAGTLPDNPNDRQAVAGFITDTIYQDSRITLYNRTGDLFAGLCAIITTLLFLDTLYHWRKNRKIQSRTA